MPWADFEHIARAALERWGMDGDYGKEQLDYLTREIVTELRDVWNARGAADIAKAENVLSERGMAAPMIWLDPALRSLDR